MSPAQRAKEARARARSPRYEREAPQSPALQRPPAALPPAWRPILSPGVDYRAEAQRIRELAADAHISGPMRQNFLEIANRYDQLAAGTD